MTLTHLTLEEWDALPEDGDRRLELVEGVVVVVPPPRTGHQFASARLWAALDRALPLPRRVVQETGVVLTSAPPTVRVPDLVVLAGPVDPRRNQWAPHEVCLVVEILSPSHRHTDLVAKRAEYAAARIAEYWIVDLDAPSLTQLRLAGSGYELLAEHTGTATIETCGTSITVDLDTLGT